jgi:hypothetical protein
MANPFAQIFANAKPEWNPHIKGCIVAEGINASWNNGHIFVVIGSWQWHGPAQNCPLHDEIAGLFERALPPDVVQGDNNFYVELERPNAQTS